ncbi:Uncharacterised protein [Enterobacter cancerogenus]|uniref:Uncharacterized protein n=1 Tax=Enterobacter cancerogenus TaxID=69218 RepID=A0A484Z9T3_9ENTR|nr:Uncharacterised protein [Enterobacter cancerogenus]
MARAISSPTLVSIGQIAGAVVGILRNTGVFQPVPGLFTGLCFFRACAFVTAQRRPQAVAGAHMPPDHHVFKHRHVVKQAHVLEGSGDPGGGHLLDLFREVGFVRK